MAAEAGKYRHVAFAPGDISLLDINQLLYEKYIGALKEVIGLQTELNIEVFTFYLLSEKTNKSTEHYERLVRNMTRFFDEIAESCHITKNKIKIGVFGKWYKLPSELVESIKKAVDATKDNSNLFLNFCINYDGQEEVLDACRLIAMHVKQGNLDPEMITKETIEEHTYSSYYKPPEIMIAFGKGHKLNGFLLWDSTDSRVYFVEKEFSDAGREDVLSVLDR